MQDAAEAKRKKEAEALCYDTWHVKGGCWNAWMKDQRTSENKELWLIYVQVILAVRISKQYLLFHVGNWYMLLQNVIESFCRPDKWDSADVCWCHLETLLKWSEWSEKPENCKKKSFELSLCMWQMNLDTAMHKADLLHFLICFSLSLESA